ncbi:MAG: gliding motility-associated C-terminal domain-containing protein [Candidatus Latescibacteria bacterium]|nr:gliding motility-associated C-terminal domain-containing protein [Candidatus Latescibacterota bacterium]
MNGSSRWPGLLSTASGLVFLVFPEVSALETIAIGQGGGLDWQGRGSAPVIAIDAEYRAPLNPNDLRVGNAPGDLVEFASPNFPGSLLLRRLEECPSGLCPEANIADGALERGGSIRTPTIVDFTTQFKRTDLTATLKEIISSRSGGETLALERKNLNAFGMLLILDLGARFGVNRLRFYPRNTVQRSPSTPFQNDFLRAYEIFVNDGLNLTKDGTQIWEPLFVEKDNKNPVVDISVDPPRYVQSIRLRSISSIDFEIDEIEVYGKGFLPTAVYVSDIFDAGGPAVWGRLRWIEETLGEPGFSRVKVRTRTGTDASSFVFTRKLRGKPGAEEIPLSLQDPTREMTSAEYKGLPQTDGQGREWEPGSVKDDLVNWSPFSTPFPERAANGPGLLIISPSPRRYFQFQVLFQSDDLEAARVLRSLSVDFLTPPLADELVGEIFPRTVEGSQPLPFVYAVRPVMQTAGLRGFDTIELSTPTRVESIDRLEVLDRNGQLIAGHNFTGLQDTSQVDGFQLVSTTDEKFTVRFPRIQEDNTQVRMLFRTRVLTYSTNFPALALLSTEPGIAQSTTSGNVTELGTADDPDFSGTTVLSPSVRGQVLSSVELVPNPFTPNGDRVNDEISVRYSLLSLGIPRPVNISVYDLSGRRVYTLYNGFEPKGRYEEKRWDGRDEQGQRVAPGLYVVRIRVDGDARGDEQARAVAVVY